MVIKKSMREFMALLQVINQSSQNHGEELLSPIKSMDSKTHHGNGSILHRKKSKTLVTLVLLKKSTASQQTTRVSFQHHTKDNKRLIHLMDNKTHIQQPFPKRWILVTKKLTKPSTDSSTKTTACTQLLIQEKSTPIMES